MVFEVGASGAAIQFGGTLGSYTAMKQEMKVV